MSSDRTFADILTVYKGSDGEATKALYAELEAMGPAGIVAVNLFRACKCSERAKVYRGRRYKDAAYDRKQWSIENLCSILEHHAPALGITWGWGIDSVMLTDGSPHYHVLYVELPQGQVSFHTDVRAVGPSYTKEWDGVRNASAERSCRWAHQVLCPKAYLQWSQVGDLTSWSPDPTMGCTDATDPGGRQNIP